VIEYHGKKRNNMAQRKKRTLIDRRNKRRRYQGGDELSAKEKSEQKAEAIKEAVREKRMEGYDAKTQKRAIRKHETDMRRKYRKSDKADPLAGERTRADRKTRREGYVAHGQEVVSTPKMFGMEGEKEYKVRYQTPRPTVRGPLFLSGPGRKSENLSDRATRYMERREGKRERVKDRKAERAKKKYLRSMPKGSTVREEGMKKLRGKAKDARQKPKGPGPIRRFIDYCRNGQCRRAGDAGFGFSKYVSGGFGKIKRGGGMKKCKYGC
jgi:hypothetical protein